MARNRGPSPVVLPECLLDFWEGIEPGPSGTDYQRASAFEVKRDDAAVLFPFLAEHFFGRRSAIRELTHREPEFVFWIYPDGRLHDARRSHRDNVPRGFEHISKTNPITSVFSG